MTIEEFLGKYDAWYSKNKEEIKSFKERADEEYKLFISLFGTEELLERMSIMDYAFQAGQNSNKQSLCYLIDFGTDELGINRTPIQAGYQRYGIQMKEDGDWLPFGKKENNKSPYGKNESEVFNTFKKRTIELLKATKSNDEKTINDIKMPQLHKNKLHFIYSERKSIPMYAQPHLDTVLRLFDQEIKKESTFAKRNRLLSLLKSMDRDDITPDLFVSFFYGNEDYKALFKGDKNTIVRKEVFNGDCENVELDLNTEVKDFDGSEEDKRAVGEKGQEIVYAYLNAHHKDLGIKKGTKIRRVFENSEKGIHCDFAYTKSLDGVDTDVYVEVKATRKNDPKHFHFQMSGYEKLFMDKHSDHYSVYYINDVFNATIITELFPKHIKMMLQPIKYLVNSKRK